MSDTDTQLPLAGKKPPRKATEAERRKINRLLDSHMHRLSGTEDEPGEADYMNDMTDAKIAAQVSPELSPSSVANIRLQIFGKFPKRQSAEASRSEKERAELLAAIDDRMSKAEAMIAGTAARLEQMEGEILKLAVKYNRAAVELLGENAEQFTVSTAWERRHEGNERDSTE